MHISVGLCRTKSSQQHPHTGVKQLNYSLQHTVQEERALHTIQKTQLEKELDRDRESKGERVREGDSKKECKSA